MVMGGPINSEHVEKAEQRLGRFLADSALPKRMWLDPCGEAGDLGLGVQEYCCTVQPIMSVVLDWSVRPPFSCLESILHPLSPFCIPCLRRSGFVGREKLNMSGIAAGGVKV
jgi:hypothetical protein